MKITFPNKTYYYKNREKSLQWHRDHWKKRRIELLRVAGGENGLMCKKCGFDDYRALQVDHIFGGGREELKTLKDPYIYKLVVRQNPEKYQVLCANCNWIKKYENNENRKIKKTI